MTALDARIKFERKLDDAAKRAVSMILRSGDPIEGRERLRDLLRRVAKEAALTPAMFEPDEGAQR